MFDGQALIWIVLLVLVVIGILSVWNETKR